jgi:predicted MPP superfamily phosphohydrolase
MSRAVFYIIFVSVAVAITVGIHIYIWRRLIRDTALPSPWRQLATGLLLTLGLSQPAVFALSRVLEPEVAQVVLFIPYLWMGMMLYLVLLSAVWDVARLLQWLVRRASAPRAEVVDHGRRLAFSRVLAGATAVGTGGIALLAQRTAMAAARVRPLEVSLERLPPELDGTSVVQLTDLHLGPTLGREWLQDVVRRTMALRPDLVAITGDLVDGSVEKLRSLVEPLGELRAPLGVFFVTGNHEYYSGAEYWIDHVQSLGIRVLRNQRVTIHRGGAAFDLAGIDDHNARRHLPDHGPDLPAALAGRDPRRELVLLAHQPRAVHQAAEHGVGLMLSGHTHGGQFWPWNYLVHLQQPYVLGLHRHGPTEIYVSPGTGFWGPPMRLGTASEITRVTLRAGRRRPAG